MLTKSRVVQLLFMMVVLVGLFFWRTFNDKVANSANADLVISPKVDLLRCDYSQACEFITEHGTFLLSIKELPVQAEEWIDFELVTPIKINAIKSAKIVGKSMFMGRIPINFNKNNDNNFTAKGLVGACTTDEMIWELQISISEENVKETLLFDFVVRR